MLQVDHGPARRASTSSALSHADSFHSLPSLSHELHEHEDAVTLPHTSGANTDNAYAAASSSYAESNGHQTCTLDTSDRFTQKLDGYGDDLVSTNMERKDSKFTVSSSSDYPRRYSSTTKRTSITPSTSRRPSMSRHTSFSQSGLQRPQLGSRRNTQTQEDAYAAHARACALFPGARRASRPSSLIYSAPTSQASLLQKTSQTALVFPGEPFERELHSATATQSRAASCAGTMISAAGVASAMHDSKSIEGAELAPQQTIIDWMDPSTRKKTYEDYDRDRRGMRGLWRKLTPNCFWRGSRVEFYDEKNSDDDDDACSVRRHRLDLDSAEGDVNAVHGDKVDGRQVRNGPRAQYKRSWSCFGRVRDGTQ